MSVMAGTKSRNLLLLSAAALLGTCLLTDSATAQVRSISQLSDVRPSDAPFQQLQALSDRYGCLNDGTTFANRVITRYEFAAMVNSCSDSIADLLSVGGVIQQEDLSALQQLQDEFAAELANLNARVNDLEARVSNSPPINNPFSTTTKLEGEVFFGTGFEGPTFEGANFYERNAVRNNRSAVPGDISETFFGGRARLELNTSFTGTDQLRTRLATAGPPEPQTLILDDLFYTFEIEVLRYSGSDFDATVPSLGDDLAIVSPGGPGSPSGGGIRINDGGIGFADILDARTKSEYYAFYFDGGIGKRFSVGDGITLKSAAGIVIGQIDESASFSGRTGFFNNTTQVDFQTTSDLDTTYVGVSGRIGATIPLNGNLFGGANPPGGPQVNLIFDAQGQLRYNWQDGHATLESNVIDRPERQNLDASYWNVGLNSSFGIEVQPTPHFKTSLSAGIQVTPTTVVILSPDEAASTDTEYDTSFIGTLRSTFEF